MTVNASLNGMSSCKYPCEAVEKPLYILNIGSNTVLFYISVFLNALGTGNVTGVSVRAVF